MNTLVRDAQKPRDDLDDVRLILSLWETDRRSLATRAREARKKVVVDAAHVGETRCKECYLWKPDAEFIGRRGKRIRWCSACAERARASNRGELPPPLPPRMRADVDLRASLIRKSHNRKLGGIPTSITSRVTCPPSCSFYGQGCYAEVHLLGVHWRRVGREGDSWEDFCHSIEELPAGQLWRHNTAGDLPGRGEDIDTRAMQMLVRANRGRRGFTFTHKHTTEHARDLVRQANAGGFVVNLSADNLKQADELAALGIGPVAVVVHSATPNRGTRTPAGRPVVVCPAQRTDVDMSCAKCKLCAIPTRKAIIGFRAHGVSARRVDGIVSLRRSRDGAELPVEPTVHVKAFASDNPRGPGRPRGPHRWTRDDVQRMAQERKARVLKIDAPAKCREPTFIRSRPTCGKAALAESDGRKMCVYHASLNEAKKRGGPLPMPKPSPPTPPPKRSETLAQHVERLLSNRGFKLAETIEHPDGMLTFVSDWFGHRRPLMVKPMGAGYAMTLGGTVTDADGIVSQLTGRRRGARKNARDVGAEPTSA